MSVTQKKIVLLGDGAVGKTSLVHRYVEGQFNDKYKATIGVDIFSKKVGNIDLQIWDLSGQEHFAAVRNKFYQKAEGALLVFDLTNKKSFDNLDKWVQESRNGVGSNIPIVLLGNKSDLPELAAIKDPQIADYSKGKNFKWMKTSAKTGENVEGAFSSIANFMSGK